MWWDKKIEELTEETARLTRLRDEAHNTTGEVAGFDDWEPWEIRERFDSALDDASDRLRAWQVSVPALRTASTEVDVTSARSEQSAQEWGTYSARSRRWARLAVDTWLVALAVYLVWLPAAWLFATLAAGLAVSVIVGMWRVHRGDALGDIASATELDYVDAMVEQELMVERLNTGLPVDSTSEVTR
jgi:hypothetical protein